MTTELAQKRGKDTNMELSLISQFERKTCGNCGVEFFIPKALEGECLRTGQAWCCPNGHRRSYTESETDKYKRLYEKAESARVVARAEAENALESARRLRTQLEKASKKKVKR